MIWRFYPLADYVHTGVLVSPENDSTVAQFLTLAEAKANPVRRKGRRYVG